MRTVFNVHAWYYYIDGNCVLIESTKCVRVFSDELFGTTILEKIETLKNPPSIFPMFHNVSGKCCLRLVIGRRRALVPPRSSFSSFISTSDLHPHPISQGDTRLSITSIEDDAVSVNSIYIRQSIIMFPKSFYLWNARTVRDINLSSLSLIPVLFPTLEMLIIGCGKSTLDVIPTKDMMEDFRQRGIVLEFMSSHHAATTFNILNEEDRHVGAAILLNTPPTLASEEDFNLLNEFRSKK